MCFPVIVPGMVYSFGSSGRRRTDGRSGDNSTGTGVNAPAAIKAASLAGPCSPSGPSTEKSWSTVAPGCAGSAPVNCNTLGPTRYLIAILQPPARASDTRSYGIPIRQQGRTSRGPSPDADTQRQPAADPAPRPALRAPRRCVRGAQASESPAPCSRFVHQRFPRLMAVVEQLFRHVRVRLREVPRFRAVQRPASQLEPNDDEVAPLEHLAQPGEDDAHRVRPLRVA